jgi:hypothetical protein
MCERAVREKNAKDEYASCYEDEIEQIFRDHLPHYSNVAGSADRMEAGSAYACGTTILLCLNLIYVKARTAAWSKRSS